MGKMQNALIFTAMLELVMLIFQNNTAGTSLLTFILNPYLFTQLPWWIMINNYLWFAAAGGTIVAGLLLYRIDFPLYLSVAVVFAGFIMAIIQLWQWIASQLWFLDANNIIATIVCAPLLIYYLLTTMEWARRAD